MIQILSTYFYPDTLAKLFTMDRDRYYLKLCSDKVGHNIYTLRDKDFNDTFNYQGYKAIIKKTNETLKFTYRNHEFDMLYDNAFNKLMITNIFTPQDNNNLKKLIQQIPRFFIEFYEETGFNIIIENSCILYCKSLEFKLQIGQGISEIWYKISPSSTLINIF